MEKQLAKCPRCSSSKVVRNGYNRKQIQRLVCKACDKHFQADYHQFSRRNTPNIQLINSLLQERTSLRGIARCVKASASSILRWARKYWRSVPNNMCVDWNRVSCHYAEIQLDEAWSFVCSKAQRLWLMVARDVESQQIIALNAGRRDRNAVRAVLRKIPSKVLENASFFTDDWAPFAAEIPKERHYIGKEYTHEIEGVFCAFRQRNNRLTRKTVGFSKNQDNHLLSIRATIARLNLSAQT